MVTGDSTAEPLARQLCGWIAPTVAVLVIGMAFFYRLGGYPLFDEPNDAQYAEVAREMVESGDWVTPRLNYVVFLNKPPLLYWLISSAFAVSGVNEFAARLPGLLVTVGTLVLLYVMGRELFGRGTGLLALAVYASMPSTFFEARTVRPDGLLTAATLAALLAFVLALRSDGRRRRHAIWGLQVALAVGVMAKGIVGLLLPSFPIVAVLIAEREGRLFRQLVNPARWWPFLLLVVPWHALAAWRNTGFLWDYVVQQHFLFFFDRKVPRDSVPVALPVFWGAFFMRLFPWTVFAPVTIWHATKQLARGPRARFPPVLLLSWIGGVLAFFSLSPARLEHYALPALPAFALLLAELLHRWPDETVTRQRVLRVHVAALAVVFVAAGLIVPGILQSHRWLAPAQELPTLARLYFTILAVASGAALIMSRRRPCLLAPVICTAALLSVPVVHRGLAAIAPLDTSASVASILATVPGDDPTLVFDAPIEYQTCAGLNYYLRRKIAMLRPRGFAAPAYLHPYEDDLFIGDDSFVDLWQRQPVILIADPLAASLRARDGITRGPFVVLGDAGTRRLLWNGRPSAVAGGQ